MTSSEAGSSTSDNCWTPAAAAQSARVLAGNEYGLPLRSRLLKSVTSSCGNLLCSSTRLRRMLDAHWALFHARAARGAVPQLIFGHDVADEVRDRGHSGQGGLIGLGQLEALHARVGKARSSRASQQASLAVHVRPDLDDQLARLERLAGVERRAKVEAPTAAHAGIEVDQLFPVEFLEFSYPEVLLLFDIGDQSERISRIAGAEKNVHRPSEDVRQLADRDVHQQGRVREHVRPPGARVQAAEHTRVHTAQDQRKRVRDPVDGRRVVVRGSQPQGLQQEASDAEEEQDAEHDRIVRQVPPELGQPLPITAIQRHQQADNEQQAKEIDDNLVDDVKGAVEETEPEVWSGNIGFQQHDECADEECDEAVEDKQVHDPGVCVAGPDQSTVDERHGERLAQPFADVVEGTKRLASSPHEIAAGEAVREHQRLDGDQRVHDDNGDLADVPGNRAGRHALRASRQHTHVATRQRIAQPTAAEKCEQRTRRDDRRGGDHRPRGGEAKSDEHDCRGGPGLEPLHALAILLVPILPACRAGWPLPWVASPRSACRSCSSGWRRSGASRRPGWSTTPPFSGRWCWADTSPATWSVASTRSTALWQPRSTSS